MIHIMIQMNRYSICISDTFCLILDQKNLIYPQISLEFGNFNDQIILNLNKMYHLRYRVTKMNDMICIV